MWALDVETGSWEPYVRGVLLGLGIVLFVITLMSILRTMVSPQTSPSVIYALILRGTDATFNAVVRPMRSYYARNRVLTWSGPIGIVAALFLWLLLFLATYTLMIFGVGDGSIQASALQAGSGLLTLGLAGTPSESTTVIDFLAAMTGPAVIALLIGFLPTLYQAYLAREQRVLLSSEITGAPAWGPELIARLHMLNHSDGSGEPYTNWVGWCAQTRLTQTLYPALNRFRSPVVTRNWIISLLAIMDSAAIQIAAMSKTPKAELTYFLEQSTQTLLSIYACEIDIDEVIRFHGMKRRVRVIMGVFGVSPAADTDTPTTVHAFPGVQPSVVAVAQAITLDNVRSLLAESGTFTVHYGSRESSVTRADFGEAMDYIRKAGVTTVRSDDEAFEIFRHVRSRYESAAFYLAERFSAPAAPWSGPRRPATPTLPPAAAADQLPTE